MMIGCIGFGGNYIALQTVVRASFVLRTFITLGLMDTVTFCPTFKSAR